MRLAQRLSQRSLGGKVFFTNSGAEAIEAAIKLARKARRGGEIVVFEGAFHGRTLRRAVGHAAGVQAGAVRAAGARLRGGAARRGGAATPPWASRPPPCCWSRSRARRGCTCWPTSCSRRPARPATARGRRWCSTRSSAGWGGPGRCGPTSRRRVVPDAMTMAKALGGGFPIGALVTGPRLADVLAPGDHGSTFAGGPVVAAAAMAALDVIDDPALPGAGDASWASGWPPAWRAARSARGARPRPDARDRDRGRARPGAPRPARAAPRPQRHRAHDRALSAAADRGRGRGGRRAGAACGPYSPPPHDRARPPLAPRPTRPTPSRSTGCCCSTPAAWTPA